MRRALSKRRKEARSGLKKYSLFVLSYMATSESAPTRYARNGHARKSANAAAMKRASELSEWPELDSGNIHEFRLKVKELRYILQLFLDPLTLKDSRRSTRRCMQRRVGDCVRLAPIRRDRGRDLRSGIRWPTARPHCGDCKPKARSGARHGECVAQAVFANRHAACAGLLERIS